MKDQVRHGLGHRVTNRPRLDPGQPLEDERRSLSRLVASSILAWSPVNSPRETPPPSIACRKTITSAQFVPSHEVEQTLHPGEWRGRLRQARDVQKAEVDQKRAPAQCLRGVHGVMRL